MMDRSSGWVEVQRKRWPARRASLQRKERLLQVAGLLALTLALLVLMALLLDTLLDGLPRLRWDFFTGFPSRRPERAGILPALVGSGLIFPLTALFALPLGVGAAIYLEEFARRNWFTTFIEVNIANLAAVPSIIYGLLGLEVFARLLRLGESLLTGALTLALLVLPVVIVTAREALRMVPPSLREAALALGATRWQMVQHHVLPLALPGILTGTILALSRAFGEAAPLITIGALTYVAFLPKSLLSPFTTLPIQAFNWVSRPQEAFHTNAAAAIVVLMAALLLMNAFALWLRSRYQRRLPW